MQIFNTCSLSYSIGVLWCKICRHCRLRRITGFRDQNVRQYYEQQSLSTLILIFLLVGSLRIQIILSLINVSCQLLVAHLTHNNSHKNGCKSRMRICKLTNIIALIVLMIIGFTKDDKSKDSQDYLLLPSLKLSKLSKEKLKMPADAEFPVPCFGSLLPASIVLSQLSPKIMRIWQLPLLWYHWKDRWSSHLDSCWLNILFYAVHNFSLFVHHCCKILTRNTWMNSLT